MANGSKIPHSVRILVLLLRVVLGLNLFYLGWSAVFNPALTSGLSERSLGSLYASLHAVSGNLQVFFAWAFLVIGACLVVGLFTRVMAIAAIGLVLFEYWPGILTPTAFQVSAFVNDQVIVVICLLILIFSGAGSYIGLDTFIHIRLSSQHKG